MAIDVVDHGSVKEVVVWEEFRKKLPEDLKRVLDGLLDQPKQRLCVNLEGVLTTLSSAALEVLVGAARRLERRGDRLALTGCRETVQTILKVTRLEDRFVIVGSWKDLDGELFVVGAENGAAP